MTGLVNPWLIVLNMDIKTLFQKDYRVCSADFDEDDFVVPKRAADPNNPKKVSLKKCAVPRVKAMATDRLEVKWFAYLSCDIRWFTVCRGRMHHETKYGRHNS